MSATQANEALYQYVKHCIDDFTFFAKNELFIATKQGALKPLQLNSAQLYLHERIEQQLAATGQVRALVLKGRQQGISTYTEGRFYWKSSFRKGVRAFIMTHLQQATDDLFSMVERYHNNISPELRNPSETANAKEFKFARNDSGYKVATAGTKAIGRGSTIHYFHGSEVAYWTNAATHAAGALQAVPRFNETEIILESTANGIGGYFHEQWQKAEAGESEFIAIFIPWFWQSEYAIEAPAGFRPSEDEGFYLRNYGLTLDQAYWMHIKNIELHGTPGEIGWLFLQEYPFCPADAFQSSGEDKICKPHKVAEARKRQVEAQEGSHLLGVDPARYGADRSSWIHRNRRRAWGLESFTKISTTELAGKVAREIERCEAEGDPVDAVFIDEVGIGAGVVDALRDMGYKHIVIPVNAGSKADFPEEYVNKRVEMWDLMARWLDEEVQIPDVDSLHADLIAPTYSYNGIRQQKVLETKEQMKKRGVRSPDEAEALALTFAYPIRPRRIARTRRLVRRFRDWRAM